MRKLVLAGALSALLAGPALADEVKIGILLGFTGPLETITPHMANAAEFAFKEINDSGLFLGGKTITPVRADSTCVDSSAATAAAERLVSSERVVAIMGADCSGASMAVLQNVAIPQGVPMISPSSTSPGFTTVEDDGRFFRTAPSDARQGAVLTEVLVARGITSAAVTYTQNDYGRGLADSFIQNFTAAGGTVTINSPHVDGKGDYSAEVGTLASAGGEVLVVLGYVDRGGAGIVQNSIESGAFETFVFGDGMYGQSLIDAIGSDLNGSFGVVPWSEGEGTERFNALATAAGLVVDSSYTRESYDAAALLALAAQAAGEATPDGITANILRVANAPGEPILPGELARGLEILAGGGEINYMGASNVNLIGPGEAAGSYLEYVIQDGSAQPVRMR
jgi:branched-chain amino acid transport system substrate-binding protein